MRSIVRDEVLPVMAEVESIINCRPLIPITIDSNNDEPLTPNHLLLLRSNISVLSGLFDKKDCYVRQSWKQAQYLADQFWRRWIREYLPNINYRQKWYQAERNLQLNDLVLLTDDTIPRSKWTMGRIVDTFPDKHERVRSVAVKITNSVLMRQIAKLCLVLPATCSA